MNVAFPNESPHYRLERHKLLVREAQLRREMAAVAEAVRALPPGGEVPEDYEFDCIAADGWPGKIRLSQLFRPGTNSLIAYHFMFPRQGSDERNGPATGPAARWPLETGPCPSCTALLDGWDGVVPHIEGLGANIVVVAKAPIDRVAAFADDHGWRHLKMLSAAGNSFKRDYLGEDEEGQQLPMLTVFHKDESGVIRLSWASELLYEATEPGQDPRHCGTVEPTWTLLDLTRDGRPLADEQFNYVCCDDPAGWLCR